MVSYKSSKNYIKIQLMYRSVLIMLKKKITTFKGVNIIPMENVKNK